MFNASKLVTPAGQASLMINTSNEAKLGDGQFKSAHIGGLSFDTNYEALGPELQSFAGGEVCVKRFHQIRNEDDGR